MRTLLISGIFLVFIVIQLMRGAEGKRTIDGDGSGYYAYLTTILVHKTTDFTPVFEYEKSKRGLDYVGHYFHQKDDVLTNKYFLGTALLILPFYLLALFYSLVTGMPPDGYNILFQYAVALAAACYTAIGLLATGRLLQTFNIDRKLIFVLLIALLLCTNLFYYTFLHPSHSHAYSFFAIAVLLVAARQFFISHTKRSLYIAAFAMGLVVLIRPSNVIVLFALPFLAENLQRLRSAVTHLLGNRNQLLTMILTPIAVVGIQLIFNLIQTGSLFYWSYKNEGFNFLNPAFTDFLFSYRKGFFLYTPFMLLLIPALYFLRESRYQLISFGSFLLLLVYFLSSWWNWFYGDSLGMRSMIDFYSLFLIPIALMVQKLMQRKAAVAFLSVFVLLTMGLNLLQSYQYHSRIIHPDAMTKEKYWYVFLKTSEGYRGVLGGFPETYHGNLEEYEVARYFLDMEERTEPWSLSGLAMALDAFSGRTVAQMNEQTEYSPTLILEGSHLRETSAPVYVKASLSYREFEPNHTINALLVYAATNRNNELVFYKTFRMKEMPDFRVGIWRTAEFGFSVPQWTSDISQIKIYVWNKEKKNFQLDDFKVIFYFTND
jgi:hypothetical protein